MNEGTDLIGTLTGHGWADIGTSADSNIRCFIRDGFKVNVFLNTGMLSLINLNRVSSGRYVMTTDSRSILFDMTVTHKEFMDTVCGKSSCTNMRIENLKNLRTLEAL